MKRGVTKQLVHEPNIPVNNNNTGDTSNVSVDNSNLDTGSEAKHYDTKMPPTLSVPPVLNIDSQNYMIHVSNSSEARPRSFSFTNGSTKTSSINNNNRQLMQRHYYANKNPLDLDMFCVKETVSSLASAVLSTGPKVQEKRISSPSVQASNSGCARALSFHNVMCSCNTSCCCMCAPDCNAWYYFLCDVPQLPTSKQKVSDILNI